jgi:hypothetical protein
MSRTPKGSSSKRSKPKAARKPSTSGLTRRQILSRLAQIGTVAAWACTITGYSLKDLFSKGPAPAGPRTLEREFHGEVTPSGNATFRHIRASDQMAVQLEERGKVVVVASASESNTNATASHSNSCLFSCDSHIPLPDYLEPAS